MKIEFFAMLTFSLLLASCGGTSETVETTDTTATTVTAPDSALNEENFDIGESSGYASDWSLFRSAVSDNNLDDFKLFMGPDVSDPEGLLMSLQEEWVMTKLVETPYEDLTVSDYNGTPVKEFAAGVQGSDDEGNIYESGIYLYFEEGPDGLMLVNVLMAG